MAKKKKYKAVKGAIDTNDAAMQAIRALDIAGVAAQAAGDYKTLATVGLGWAVLSNTVHSIEVEMKSAIEVAELQSETERFVNPVGFSPGYEGEDDDE